MEDMDMYISFDIENDELSISLEDMQHEPQLEELKRMLIAVFCLLRRHDIPYEEVFACMEGQSGKDRSLVLGELVEKAINFIDCHFHDHSLSSKAICGHLHISTVYFSRIFKERTGVTFISYLTQVRIKKAAELLSTKDLKTSSVAYSVGYSDPYYFTRVFKKIYGMPPSKYKELIQPKALVKTAGSFANTALALRTLR